MRATLAALSLSLFLEPQHFRRRMPRPLGSATNSPDYTAINCSGSSPIKSPTKSTSSPANSPIPRSPFLMAIMSISIVAAIKVCRLATASPSSVPTKIPWMCPGSSGSTNYQSHGPALHRCRADSRRQRAAHISVAEVGFSCGWIQRGDIVRPYVERPSPAIQGRWQFRSLRPCKRQARGHGRCRRRLHPVVWQEQHRLRQSRQQPERARRRLLPHLPLSGHPGRNRPANQGYQYKCMVSAAPPPSMNGKICPAKLVGEGVVINEGPNASTVLITYSSLEIYAGDYVELE